MRQCSLCNGFIHHSVEFKMGPLGPECHPCCTRPPVKSIIDLVNRPAHYIAKNGMEAIDVIEGFELSYKLGAAVKYILRCGKKLDAIEDLKKARWYIDREIKQREGK